MGKYCVLLVLSLGIILPAMAQTNFYLDMARFRDSKNRPYIEIYVAVDGTSIQYQQEKDKRFHASVNLDVVLNKLEGKDTLLVDSTNYNLLLGEGLRDTTLDSRRTTLWRTHTLYLTAGKYLLQALALDNHDTLVRRTLAISEFEVDSIAENHFNFSDVKWVGGIIPHNTDGGRARMSRDDLIPQVSNSAFFNQDTMIFYQELYNVIQVLEGKFAVRAMIYQGNKPLWAYEFTQLKSPSLGKTSVFYGNFDISQLPSQSYNLKVDLLNLKNEVMRSFSKKFYVYNSRVEPAFLAYSVDNDEAGIFGEYSEEQLDYYLNTLFFIATEQERNFVKALSNYEQKKNYMYSFWTKRKQTPDKKVVALWKGHLAALDYINKEFKSDLREGWQTDRGRVFLQNGIPNDVRRFPRETGLVPYEIWRYNKLGSQNNVTFIFYDPDLISDEYPLLHSTKYSEVRNPRWRTQLQLGDRTPSGVDFENQDRPQTDRYNTNLDIDN